MRLRRVLRRRGRGSSAQLAAAVVASALLTLVLLLVLGYPATVQGAAERSAARTFVAGDGTSDAQVSGSLVAIDGRPLSLALIYGEWDPSLVPPGLSRLPRPGEAIVSPGVVDLCRPVVVCPIRERIVGTIASEGLVNPVELYAYIAPGGEAPEGALPVGSLGDVVVEPQANRTASLGFVTFALAPAAGLLTVAVRYGARRDARRILALRTMGMSRLGVAVDLAVPALGGAFLGAVLGALVYPSLTALAGDVPLVGSSYDASDLAANGARRIVVVVLVAAIVGLSTLIGAARHIGSSLRSRPSTPRRLVVSGSLTLALALGIILLAERAFTLYGDSRSSSGGLWSNVAIALLAVGLMGGAAPIASSVARRIPLRAQRAAVGLGARRADRGAPAATRASGPVGLMAFLACVVLSMNGLYQAEAGPSFRDEPGERTTFATRDGATTTVRPADLDGVVLASAAEVAVEDGNGTPVGRALVATCDDAGQILAATIENCSGRPQVLQIISPSLSSSASGSAPGVARPVTVGGTDIELDAAAPPASVTTNANLPFADLTLLIPPSLLPDPVTGSVQRVIGSVTSTRDAFREVTVRAARTDPTTALDLPSVARPDVVGAYRWLALGSLVGGAVSLLAMGTAFADVRAQQLRGYAMLHVLGAPPSTTRLAHATALAVPAMVNAVVATSAGVLAGLALARRADQLPSPWVYLAVAAGATLVCLLVALATSPRRLLASLVSGLIRAE